jgi:excinuclease ABC subunit A
VLQIGMQFLGTASVVCEACGGRRFNDETLEVRCRGKNIHDVLEMSIEQAAGFFAAQPAAARGLAALRDLGLGYLALGHPATMLSGGEAQRVKLAAELARPGTGRTLYVLDEPTAGLHQADVASLLSAIDRLVAAGNTVVVIEHDLDVIKVADWVVDLGPESGPAGGRVVAMGRPEAVAACDGSVTGAVLREERATADADRRSPGAADLPRHEAPSIRLTNVCTHNLQHLDVEIPANRLTVITGVSGSGKSSLAFDTLFAESQQRFTDSFSTYARRFLARSSEAEFDQAPGLTPAIAIRQRLPSRNPRSTVATLTEIHDACRLLYARAGARACPRCSAALDASRCPRCGFKGAQALMASMFSPNSEHGACPACRGLGFVLDCDASRLVTDPSRPLAGGAMAGHKTGRFYGDPHGQHMAILSAVGRAFGADFALPWRDLPPQAQQIALRGTGDRTFDVEWAYVRGKRAGVHRFQARWPGLLAYVRDEYERKHADRRGEAIAPLMAAVRCDACGGGKLQAEFLAVRFGGVAINELLAMNVDQALVFFDAIDAGQAHLSGALGATADARSDIVRRLRRLRDAGLAYLTLDRPAASLSGGEAQRVRLATELGSGLTGITYVLDEPTVGLHPRDTSRLVGLLHELRTGGNTVVVVEHDREVIAAADFLIEVGPGAGRDGGRIVARGTPAQFRGSRGSRTAELLAQPAVPELSAPRRHLVPGVGIRGATIHNLENLNVDLPAGGIVCVTGVSGSGKSTLVFDVLASSADRGAPVNCRAFTAHADFRSVVRVGHASAFGSSRSTPATHIGVFDDVRELFAHTETAAALGLPKQQFSTLAPGGRCEACEGLGHVRVSTCDECHGRRYRPEVLQCLIDGRSIADVLDMTVEAAGQFFTDAHGYAARSGQPGIKRRIDAGLAALCDVGLGYVRLGQPARTLSGGERQRLVLAAALVQPAHGASLYLFDEPTTGLHRDDVAQLLRVFDRLAEAGHTLVIIEHDLDVIAHADWVIDLGPEGGPGGGRVVAAGPAAAIARVLESHTGRALRSA